MAAEPQILKWLDDVEDQDFDAALNYLSIKLDPHRARLAIEALHDAEITHRRSNDLLRATDRSALPLDDLGVHHDLLKVIAGKKLSPILVVSFSHGADFADGYHRASLSYLTDPFSVVPCRIAEVPHLQ